QGQAGEGRHARRAQAGRPQAVEGRPEADGEDQRTRLPRQGGQVHHATRQAARGRGVRPRLAARLRSPPAMVAISVFEVPVEADEGFVGGWAGPTLLKALRADVDFRFVAVGDAEAAAGEFAVHSALYEVVHEEGTPDGAGGVVLINPFEVPDGADAEFLAAWE